MYQVLCKVMGTNGKQDLVLYSDAREKVTGLMEGCDYQFRVTAVNAAGNSEPSEASNFISCREPSCEFQESHINLMPIKTMLQIIFQYAISKNL